MAALRQEVSQLRDTSTRFDVSLQHTLERIEQRLDYLENKTAARSEPEARVDVSREPDGGTSASIASATNDAQQRARQPVVAQVIRG
jgi:phage shock protein A